MKLALITDTHWGIRNDNQVLIENNKRFLDNVFFPYLDEHKIDTVIHLGDLVDRRKYINYYTAQRLRKDFIEPMRERLMHMLWILGNHDIYYRHSLEVSAASELYDEFSDVIAYFKHPEEVTFDGTPILFLPWICDENREKTLELINTTQAQIVFGHLEMQGFEMFKGVVSHHGEDPNLFKKFDVVCTGHYHHKSSHGGIHYLGSHGEFTWADFGDERGFHIFDTKTRSLEFIPNPYKMFEKVFYDDTRKECLEKEDFSHLEGKFVKVIVTNRTKPSFYDWFLGQVEDTSPLDLTVVQDHLNLDIVNDENIVNETKDTLTIVRDYVAAANTSVNAVKLDSLFVELYNQAQANE